MPRFTVKHHQAVWETTTFEVEVPDDEDPVEYIREKLDELMAEAIEESNAEGGDLVELGDHVASMDTDIEILDANGATIYSDVDPNPNPDDTIEGNGDAE